MYYFKNTYIIHCCGFKKKHLKKKGKKTPKANYLAMFPVLDIKKVCVYTNIHTQQLKYTCVHIIYMIYSNKKIIGDNQIFLNCFFLFKSCMSFLVNIHVYNHP